MLRETCRLSILQIVPLEGEHIGIVVARGREDAVDASNLVAVIDVGQHNRHSRSSCHVE